jgi:hypothetical protein
MLASRRLSEHLEYLFQAVNVAFRFPKVFFNYVGELRLMRFFGHLRQHFEQLILRAVQITEIVDEQILD